MLKNQPKKGKKDKAEKKARRAKAKENGSAETNGNTHAGSGESNSDNGDADEGDLAVEAGSDDELTRRINAEAKEIDQSNDIKDDVWAVDVSEEAVKARAKELPDDLKDKLVVDEGEEEAEGESGGSSVYDQLGSWIISTAESKTGGVGELDSVDIYVRAKELGIEAKYKTLTVLAQTVFDEDILAQIPKRASMLKKVSKSVETTNCERTNVSR